MPSNHVSIKAVHAATKSGAQKSLVYLGCGTEYTITDVQAIGGAQHFVVCDLKTIRYKVGGLSGDVAGVACVGGVRVPWDQ